MGSGRFDPNLTSLILVIPDTNCNCYEGAIAKLK
jgi:hypothetical protein